MEFKGEREFEKEKPAIKLLDLGSGTGELANHLPKNLKIIVSDPSQAMLNKVRKKRIQTGSKI